jgi:hypothetical protein
MPTLSASVLDEPTLLAQSGQVLQEVQRRRRFHDIELSPMTPTFALV